MSATGLDVFDKTIQTANIWLDEIMEEIGPDRRVAWHVLGVVLRTVRDRIPLGLAAHLGSQLPIIIRGSYYDQWSPFAEQLKMRDPDELFAHVEEGLRDIRRVNPRNAVIAVFGVLSRHLPRGQSTNVRDALLGEIQPLWHLDDEGERSASEQAAKGKAAQQSQEARAFKARPAGQRRRKA
jgi:uncharacterized protein (DUF2267 family)